MASWSTRRKSVYGSIVAVFVILVIGLPGFFIFYKAPTCTDGILNQNEGGVDCGGKCPKICSNSFLAPRVTWARFDKVGQGLYNLGAYVVNPNVDAIAVNIPYVFRIYDKEGILIVERKGSMTIPPHKNTIAFESAVGTGQRTPTRVAFEFMTPEPSIPWQKIDAPEDRITVIDTVFTGDSNGTSLDATLQNTSLTDYRRIDLFAVLYDEQGNAMGFSKTNLDSLAAGEKQIISFTWREARVGTVATKEVVPVVWSLLSR